LHSLFRLPPDAPSLAAAWSGAAFLPQVESELRSIHLEAAEETRRQRPLCIASGDCCHFERFGHRLYVTGLETAWTLRHLGGPPSWPSLQAGAQRGDCPYLHGGQCSIHSARPLGCRLFFCDPLATAWQQDLSERLLARVRRLHDALSLPYRYGDWRTMLAHFADPAGES